MIAEQYIGSVHDHKSGPHKIYELFRDDSVRKAALEHDVDLWTPTLKQYRDIISDRIAMAGDITSNIRSGVPVTRNSNTILNQNVRYG